jgi:hypothetical protein
MDSNDGLITAEDLGAVSKYERITAQVDRLDRLLVQRGVGSISEDLLSRRVELLADLRGLSPPYGPPPPDGWDLVEVPVEAELGVERRWHTLYLPVMSQGIRETPDTPGTDGAIDTWSLGPGTVIFGGDLRDDGLVNRAEEQWWVSNWHAAVKFPPAPESGVVSYRFQVHNGTTPYQASALSGSVRATITTGTTGDAAAPITNWSGGYWPVDVALPFAPGQSRFLGGYVTISGRIPVAEGKRAALGVIFVVIISIATGQVLLLPTACDFMTMQLYVAGGALGAIEYRFDPTWWRKASSDLANFDRIHPFP